MVTNPHAHRLPELVAEARASAANPEHSWDRKAIEWPLTSDSVVVEVGGYKGRWALQIAERYAPKLYVFEPQPWAYETCREVLGDRAFVINAALGTRNGSVTMAKWETDGCSLVDDGEHGPEVSMLEISAALRSFEIDHIDLMLINIEGYEYTLIPHMLDQGILPDRLMVQFHTFADPLGVAQAQIYERLDSLGYRIAWTYGIMLTAWEKDSKNSKAS